MKGTPHLLRPVVVFMAVISMMFGSMLLQVSAQTANQCPAYGDGTGASGGTLKIDVADGIQEITFTAPDGYLIDMYCVKAGSVNNDLGPQVVMVDPASESVTITYWDEAGQKFRDISHYSVHFIPKPPMQTEWCSPGFWKNNTTMWPESVPLNTTYKAVFGADPVGKNPAVKGGTITYTDATLLFVLENPALFGGEMTNMVADYLSSMHPGIDFTGERYNYDEYGMPYEVCPLEGDGNAS